jgi:hypothetical protein
MTHADAEDRSLRLHRVIALRLDQASIDRARSTITRWVREGTLHPTWAARWLEVLGRPLPEVCATLVDPGERARDLRQCTPFTGLLGPRERWAILRGEG